MKNKILPVFLLSVLTIMPFTKAAPWGDKGHRIIAQKAFDCLPKEMAQFIKYKSHVIEHCTDPDYRKKRGDDEYPKHFIDIDHYSEYLSGRMIMDLDSLTKVYGDSVVKKEGILPWATQNTLNELTRAFKEKNKDNILLYASDLAHYVADGFQPLHATVNYNGQLSDQKGIHSRYESKLLERNEDKIIARIRIDEGYYVKNTFEYIFDYITASEIDKDIIFNADKYSYQNASSSYNDEYYRLFWFRTQYETIEDISEASRALASLYYTAWTNAGKPGFENDVRPPAGGSHQ